ncbi:MAG: hypothetical protein HPY58_14225 [Firmicutes bacterium]|nr:hypothetical protein [Bacillota bacterium]
MRRRLLVTVLAIQLCVLMGGLEAFAAGAPTNYTVNIPYAEPYYPPRNGQLEVMWQFNVPSGHKVIAISVQLYNPDYYYFCGYKIVVDGVVVRNGLVRPSKTITVTWIGEAWSSVIIGRYAHQYTWYGALGINSGTLSNISYAADQATAEAAKASADAAKTEAINAKNAADTAATIAANAKASADAAKTSADTAAARVWDSVESKSAATLAKEARDKANQALTEILNVKVSIGPLILKVSGRNNATCTRATSFDVVIQASGATEFRVKADTGSWSEWVPVGSVATATGIIGSGAHTVYVEARNAAGAMATGQMTVFKI